MIVTIKDCELEVTRISNIDIFSADISGTMPEPQVPKFYIEEQDRWVDNPDHPTYHAALSVYYANRTFALFDYILRNYVRVVDKNKINIPRNIIKLYPDEDVEFLFLKHILFEDILDGESMINLITLTETRVYPIFKSIRILRNGMDIHSHDVKNTVNTNIDYEPLIIAGHQLVHPLDEYNACVSSNISYVDWVNNQYDLDTMAKAIALYRINKIVEIHSGDAAQIESEKKSRKNNK